MNNSKGFTYAFITYKDGSRIKTLANKIMIDVADASLTNGVEGNEEERKHGKVAKIEMYNDKDELVEKKQY